jgi:hypothetical protein
MADLQAVMRFLWGMMTGGETADDFTADPIGTMAAHGVADATVADLNDATLAMVDRGAAQLRDGAAATADYDDPVGAVRHLAGSYQVDRSIDYTYHNQEFIAYHNQEFISVQDSFNDDSTTTNDVVAIQATTDNHTDIVNVQDSFNGAAAPAGESTEDSPSAADPGPEQETVAEEPADQEPVDPDPALSEPPHEADGYPQDEDLDADVPVG